MKLTKDLFDEIKGAKEDQKTEIGRTIQLMREDGMSYTEISRYFDWAWEMEKAADFQAGNCESYEIN